MKTNQAITTGHHRLFVALVGFAAAGCASTDQNASADDNEDALTELTSTNDNLKLATNESPSHGTTFDFCALPKAETTLHVGNAAWLAFLSANQNAHLGYLAPQLLDLGFGREADSLWGQCGVDLGRTRDFEAVHGEEISTKARRGAAALVEHMRTRDVLAPENFGVCARDFFGRAYTALDPDGKVQTPAAAFKDYLLRKSDDKNWIQFFSAKPYTFAEQALERGSTQVMVARHSKLPVVVVAFRGTEYPKSVDVQARSVVDILKDLDIYKTDLRPFGFSEGWGSAHRGFVTGLQSVDGLGDDALLLKKVRALTGGDPNVGIWITGHSLGAALATLFAARILDRMDHGERFALRGVYTFGSPMVGNDAFAAKLDASASRQHVPVIRFRNGDDIVTGLPGVTRILNYKHAGQLALLGPASLELATTEPGRPLSVKDHNITGYEGERGARSKTSGYYSRLVERMASPPPKMGGCAL